MDAFVQLALGGEEFVRRAQEDQGMFKGNVSFGARIKGNGLTVSLFEFNPHESGVDINGVRPPQEPLEDGPRCSRFGTPAIGDRRPL